MKINTNHPKLLKIKIGNRTEIITFVFCHYGTMCSYGAFVPAIGIQSVSEDGRYLEQYATLSVNVSDEPAAGCFWVKDWSENADLVNALNSMKILNYTERTCSTGFVNAKEVVTKSLDQWLVNHDEIDEFYIE